MNIRRIDDRPMIIHIKEKARIRSRRGRRAATADSAVVEAVKSGHVANTGRKSRATGRLAAGKKQGRKPSAGMTAAVGSAAMAELDGGGEVKDSARIMATAAMPIISAANGGRRLFASQAAGHEAGKRIKRVDIGQGMKAADSGAGQGGAWKTAEKRIKRADSGINAYGQMTRGVGQGSGHGNGGGHGEHGGCGNGGGQGKHGRHGTESATKNRMKSAHDGARKNAKKAGGKSAGKTAGFVARETAKKTAKKTAAVAAGTAATGAVGAAAGKVAGAKIERKHLKRVTRRRMMEVFVANMKQENDKDSLIKALKDIAVMRFMVLARKAVVNVLLALAAMFGIVAVAALPVVAVIAVIYNSPFAIFFPSISSGESTQAVLAAHVAEFGRRVENEAASHPGHDYSEIVYTDYEGGGVPDNYMDILAVYMVKHGIGDTATDMTAKANNNLKAVFDDMCSYNVTYGLVTELVEVEVLDDDGIPVRDEDGGIVTEWVEVTYRVKYVNVGLRTCHEMISRYGFSDYQVEMLLEIMKPENRGLVGHVPPGGAVVRVWTVAVRGIAPPAKHWG